MKPRGAWLRQLLLVVLVGILVFFPTLGRWYTEWLWFGEVGYRMAFWTPIVSRTLVGLAAGLAVFLILFPNVRPLLRLRGVPKVIDLRSAGGRTYRQITSRLRPPAVTAVVVGVVSALAGRGAAESWLTFQAWLHRVPFGVSDPIFGRDIGFYVFSLPAYAAVTDWLFSWTFFALVIVAIGYYLDLAPLLMRGVWAIPRGVRVHLAVLSGVLLLLRAVGFWRGTRG